jgi:O-antigen biosynthesis protein
MSVPAVRLPLPSQPLRPGLPPTALVPPPQALGKFLFIGNEKFWVRGVTYGPFRPGADGREYPHVGRLQRDFAAMAAHGVNAVRVYTVPPRDLLDAARASGLRVMVGLPWEQHVTFLDERRRARGIVERVRAGVHACAGHPAVLAYAVGNEIPAPIVRWHGARRVEAFIARLAEAAREEDADALVTYVNYPTTEYLELPFLDLVTFNVYLESRERFQAYLARLQNLAGDRPLLLAEIGLDSRRNGAAAQARSLAWQVRSLFAGGGAGGFVFAWTDEWHRGGFDIEDWDFGLTDRERRPKPALWAVTQAFEGVPVPPTVAWPRVSVVVCSYNGARTIGECLAHLARLDYPDYEVIVVDDGSTDATAAIARGHGVRLISTPNRGLSAARNTGLEAATGEIVAYIDDDAWPDPHWLTYLAETFRRTSHAGAGGPNIPPDGDGLVAECVAHAPGGPAHVLVGDRDAEHIPGCNMAFRRAALAAIGGFDPTFRTAGDDVDVCWRLQERGESLGFSPAAVVWHHRRNSVRAYWRQQRGYGRAEALLEQKWPDKYNGLGHLVWAGRVYGDGVPRALGQPRPRVFHGTWGSALFQSLYERAPGTIASLPLMPEWYLVIAALALLSALGSAWPPLRWALPLLVLATGIAVAQAASGAARALRRRRYSGSAWAGRWVLTTMLHLLQPLARLRGRLAAGLTPWRRRGPRRFAWPRARRWTIWSERRRPAPERLGALEAGLRAQDVAVRRGGEFDRWDLEVRAGPLGTVRLLHALEEHGAGTQLVRLRAWTRCARSALLTAALLGGLAAWAAADGSAVAAAVLGVSAGALLGLAVRDCAHATAAVLHAVDAARAEPPAP